MKQRAWLEWLALLGVNAAGFLLAPALQEMTNPHLQIRDAVVLICWGIALGLAVIFALSGKRKGVLVLALIAISLITWGRHFDRMMCQGCLNSG